MIPLENQVCTLEQAKIFKDEFGLELESYFVWAWKLGLARGGVSIYDPKYTVVSKLRVAEERQKFNIDNHIYRAYTCAELGVLLPHKIKGRFEPVFKLKEDYDGEFEYIQEGKDYYGCFRWGYHRFTDRYQDDSHWLAGSILACETHAKSEILIECLRKGYIKPEGLKL